MNKTKSLADFQLPRWQQLPSVPLYLEQVLALLEEWLGPYLGKEDGTILTKTMINNYAKNNLIPPPEKKKYTKEHILCLIFIYYFKNILSISDI